MVVTPSPESHADAETRRHAAVELLRENRERLAREHRNRLYLANLAHQYGVPVSEIAAALGITAAGARKLIQRAEAA